MALSCLKLIDLFDVTPFMGFVFLPDPRIGEWVSRSRFARVPRGEIVTLPEIVTLGPFSLCGASRAVLPVPAGRGDGSGEGQALEAPKSTHYSSRAVGTGSTATEPHAREGSSLRAKSTSVAMSRRSDTHAFLKMGRCTCARASLGD